MDEQRLSCIFSVFHAFGKPTNDQVVSFILRKTAGISDINLIDACKRLEGYEELPRNIAREIIIIAGGHKENVHQFCPNCCVYVDNEILKIDGEPKYYSPGWRKYFWTTGDIYRRVGFSMPCNCAFGQKIRAGLIEKGCLKPENHHNYENETIKKQRLPYQDNNNTDFF